MKYIKSLLYLTTILLLSYLFVRNNIFQNFHHLNFEVYIISFFAYLLLFYVSGIQLYHVIKISTGTEMSNVDQLMIPISMNFWGYLLPFQGSLIYSLAIFKNKYDINLSKTLYVYLFISVFSLWIGGVVAFIHGIAIQHYYSALFFLQIILAPIYLKLFYRCFGLLRINNGLVKFVKFHLTQLMGVINKSIQNTDHIIKLVVYDFIFVFVYALWTFYISEYFKLNIEFVIWFLWSYFLKITLLAKITPGNIGVIQAYTSGFLVLYGYSAKDGLMISMIQLVLLIILIFPIAFINSILNLKYFGFHFFKKNRRE